MTDANREPDKQVFEFLREMYAVGGNGEGWTFDHVDAICAVALGEATDVHRRLARGVMGDEWVAHYDPT